LFIQEIPGWNQGTKIRQEAPFGMEPTDGSDFNDSFVYFDVQCDSWWDQDHDQVDQEEVDWMANNWIAVPVCPHCNGTGRPPKKPAKVEVKKGKSK
jgi:hypothetical protein